MRSGGRGADFRGCVAIICNQTPFACAAEDLDEILGNLIDNAFKWARTNVDISARKEGAHIVLMIADDGPVMSDTDIAEAFLPGKRPAETVPGDGFGLTIVKELIALYGGEITLLSPETGGTVRFLPARLPG